MLRISETYWAGKGKLLRLLSELEASESYLRTLYFTPASLVPPKPRSPASAANLRTSRIDVVLEELGESETGAVVFMGEHQIIAVVPPFPQATDRSNEGVDASPLRELLNSDLLIGVVLLRLKRYAIGVLKGDSLVASKTDTRYVKNRHRAGGTSQRRFERSRERLVRELFDKTCEITMNIISPYGNKIDYILMGGERHTLRGFIERCRYMQDNEKKTLKRLLRVDKPNHEALEKIAFEVWKSKVLVFADDLAD